MQILPLEPLLPSSGIQYQLPRSVRGALRETSIVGNAIRREADAKRNAEMERRYAQISGRPRRLILLLAA